MRSRCPLLVVATTLLLGLAQPSHAQNPNDQSALDLLEQGKNLLKAGELVEACEALEKSVALEAAINTHYQLGRCYEAQSRHATAREAYLRAATMARTAGDTARFEAAQRAADELRAKIARLVVVVAPESEIPGLAVSRGERPVPREDWGKAIPVDPGEHTIKVEAPGYQPWSQTVSAEQVGGATTVTVPKLAPIATPPAPSETAGAAELDESGYVRRSPGLFGLGIALICVGGVGVLGGGIAAGVRADAQGGAAPFAGVALGGLALLGAGIPITVIFGARVPPESEESGEPEADPDAATAVRWTPLIGPTSAGLRLDF